MIEKWQKFTDKTEMFQFITHSGLCDKYYGENLGILQYNMVSYGIIGYNKVNLGKFSSFYQFLCNLAVFKCKAKSRPM